MDNQIEVLGINQYLVTNFNSNKAKKLAIIILLYK